MVDETCTEGNKIKELRFRAQTWKDIADGQTQISTQS